MCGIAGIYNLRGAPIDREALEAMARILCHRGPDDAGLWIEGPVGLVHRRLSIIDLSPGGHQPMADSRDVRWMEARARILHEGTTIPPAPPGCDGIDARFRSFNPEFPTDDLLVISFNGEIFNYIELRKELEAQNHRFLTRSDTEVVLKAYRQWGPECVSRFNGMWAFALWDKSARRLFCSRDRFGVKPFYYHLDQNGFSFASELKALARAHPQDRHPNEPYIHHFLTTGLLDDGPETFFADFIALPPAHSLTVNVNGLRVFRHWDFDPYATPQNYDYSDPPQTFRELITDAVRLRLRSDVAVGTCLSGGLDSGAIVTLATQITRETAKQSAMKDTGSPSCCGGKATAQPVHTFSSIYDDPDCDEREFIEIINQDCRTAWEWTRPQPQDLFTILPRLVWHQDEPSSAPGLYSQWHVMKLARPQVTVLLDGQGGDELLGGYFGYFPAYLATRFREVQKEKGGKEAGRIFDQESKAISDLSGMDFSDLRRRLTGRSPSRNWLSWLTRGGGRPSSAPDPLFRPEFLERINDRIINRELPAKFEHELDQTLYNSLTRQGLPSLLHYEDRNSMAFSIEARTPFLDYRLVEFGLGLPYRMKINCDTTKWVMRKGLEGILHPKVLNRRDKKGYPTPVARWFREELAGEVAAILESPRLAQRGIIDPGVVQARLEKHRQGLSDHSWEIWRWLTLELWFQIFIDGDGSKP